MFWDKTLTKPGASCRRRRNTVPQQDAAVPSTSVLWFAATNNVQNIKQTIQTIPSKYYYTLPRIGLGVTIKQNEHIRVHSDVRCTSLSQDGEGDVLLETKMAAANKH